MNPSPYIIIINTAREKLFALLSPEQAANTRKELSGTGNRKAQSGAGGGTKEPRDRDRIQTGLHLKRFLLMVPGVSYTVDTFQALMDKHGLKIEASHLSKTGTPNVLGKLKIRKFATGEIVFSGNTFKRVDF